MAKYHRRQAENEGAPGRRRLGIEGVIPNPKLKLMDQVREVLRLKHYSIRTERCYCDWIRRYVKFHHMKNRTDLDGAEPKTAAYGSSAAPCAGRGLWNEANHGPGWQGFQG